MPCTRIIAIAEKISMIHVVRACVAARAAAAMREARYKNRGASNRIVSEKYFAPIDRDLPAGEVRCGSYRPLFASAIDETAMARQIFLCERVSK
jgi:hypothetical protein